MLGNLIAKVVELFRNLFGVKPQTTKLDIAENTKFVAAYEDISDYNLTVTVANKLADLVASDCSVQVTGGTKETQNDAGRTIEETVSNPRSKYIDAAMQKLADRLKLICVRVFGMGGVVIKPWIYKDQIYPDVISQGLFIDVERQGEIMTGAGFIAEQKTLDDVNYLRLEYHHLGDDGTYTIEQKATKDGSKIDIDKVPGWEMYATTFPMTITGVEKMLFAFVKCPTDSRKGSDNTYGVPVTYGSEKLVHEIVELMNMMHKEYLNKEAFIGADYTLFYNEDGKQSLPDSGLYKLMRASGAIDEKPLWEVFSPDIRTQSYIDAINYKMGLLEKAIGVNAGVLTDLETATATATAIKRSTYDTFSLVDSIRKNIEIAFDQYAYACDVYANAFGLAPAGEWETLYDWDYSFLEDTAQTFGQKMQLVSQGLLPPEYIIAYEEDVSLEKARQMMPVAAEMADEGDEV